MSSRYKTIYTSLLLMMGAIVALFAQNTWAFNCGPNVLTYSAADANGAPIGIRCVKYTFRGLESSPSGQSIAFDFIWYGEGHPAAGAYRQVGTACGNLAICSPPSTDVAFISGNGESKSGRLPSSQVFVTEASATPATIRFDGAFKETWSRVDDLAYSPLPAPQNCGPGLQQFEVRAIRSSVELGPIAGVRCVLKGGISDVWFGTGQWPQQSRYQNLGQFLETGPRSGGASDLCDGSVGQHCNEFAFGTLKFTPPSRFKGWLVGGAWNEAWVVPGSYKPPQSPPDLPPICRTRPNLPICQR